MPACDVTLPVSDAPGPFGVFGNFDELTLIFDEALKGKRVLAQDLAGEEAHDISNEVEIRGKSFRDKLQVGVNPQGLSAFIMQQ